MVTKNYANCTHRNYLYFTIVFLNNNEKALTPYSFECYWQNDTHLEMCYSFRLSKWIFIRAHAGFHCMRDQTKSLLFFYHFPSPSAMKREALVIEEMYISFFRIRIEPVLRVQYTSLQYKSSIGVLLPILNEYQFFLLLRFMRIFSFQQHSCRAILCDVAHSTRFWRFYF